MCGRKRVLMKLLIASRKRKRRDSNVRHHGTVLRVNLLKHKVYLTAEARRDHYSG